MLKELRNKLAIERDKWFESPEGKKCLSAETLGQEVSAEYLKNRLEFAFLAGAKAQSVSAPVPAMPIQDGQPLSDDEIRDIRNRAKLNDNRQIDPLAFAREIERAVLAKAMQQSKCDHDWEDFGGRLECTYPECGATKAMPIPKQEPVINGDANSACDYYVESLGGYESNGWHDAPVDDVFKAGFAAGQLATPNQGGVLIGHWNATKLYFQSVIFVDELVRGSFPDGAPVYIGSVPAQAADIPTEQQILSVAKMVMPAAYLAEENYKICSFAYAMLSAPKP